MNKCRYSQESDNVRITVGCYDANGVFQPKSEHSYKNTGTRIFTDNLASYLAGSENSYKKGHGRPNYFGFGTNGIRRQGNLDMSQQVLEPEFDNPYPSLESATRPEFRSTSLGRTKLDGSFAGSFWNNQYGWGTATNPDIPEFEGELATRPDVHDYLIERVPIKNAIQASDCPADYDYGENGYMTTITLRGFTPPEWVNKLLKPSVGPQLEQIAISEIGLYEKSNLDPHGLETLLAGFRVPSTDIIYLQENDVLLVEWIINVRAIMPNEQVDSDAKSRPRKVGLDAEVTADRTVDFTAILYSDGLPDRNVDWSIENEVTSGTTIDSNGRLVVSETETAAYVLVTVKSLANPEVVARAAVFPELRNNYIVSINVAATPSDYLHIDFNSDVIGKGTFSSDVTWSIEGSTAGSTIDNQGRFTLDKAETNPELSVIATSVAAPEIQGSSLITLVARAYRFFVYEQSVPSQTKIIVARLGAVSTRSMSSASIQLQLKIWALSTGQYTIYVQKGNQIITKYTESYTADNVYTLNREIPIIISNERQVYQIAIEGDGIITENTSYIYAPFIQVFDPDIIIDLDTHRFNADEALLYNKDGSTLATMVMQSGSSLSNVYTDTKGLHLVPAAAAQINVDLRTTDTWTFIFSLTNVNGLDVYSRVMAPMVTAYNARGFITLFDYNTTRYSIGFNPKGFASSSISQFYNGGGPSNSGVIDLTIPFLDIPEYEQEFRITNDGTEYKIYLNGMLRARGESSNLYDQDRIHLSTFNGFPANQNVDYTVTRFAVLGKVEVPNRFTIYRFRFTKFRDKKPDGTGYGIYRFTRLCLYDAQGNRLDTDSRCIAGNLEEFYGSWSQVDWYYDNSTKMLISNNTGVYMGLNIHGDEQLWVYLYIPSDLPQATQYSIITDDGSGTYGDEYFDPATGGDPVSWSVDKTLDAGVNWINLDNKTDYPITLERSTETPRFSI